MTTMNLPPREQALALLQEFNETERALKHALAVEGVMRYLARKKGADEQEWGTIGLVHDLDYEKFAERHCRKSAEVLRQRGWPEEAIRAVLSHGWGICSDVQPQTDLEKTLYAIDELTGLVAATALVRPSRSVMDLTAKSVRKKWREKGFAAGVDRSTIEKGAAMLGVDLDELITDTIMGMRQIASSVGLEGQTGQV
jgi:putative nucleotidyltransferase with HDIG domain